MARRTKWKGWVDPKDVSPELMARFRAYRERYWHYAKTLSSPMSGTGNAWESHSRALRDVPLSKGEQDIMSRLEAGTFEDIDGKCI